ncbi:MAG: DUF6132 family protein [Candidatus Hydrogenedentota bacterium]
MLVSLLKIGAGVAIGAGLGAMLGRTRSCETGGCPLTANPRRGAIYGGVMGLLLTLAFASPSGPVLEPDSGIIEIANAAQFNERVEQSAGPVVAYFHAPWCGACRRVGPVISELARAHGEEAVFLGVNTDEHPELARELAIEYLPTSIVFRDGREEARFIGAFDKSQLLKLFPSQQTASRYP